ncbi:MULTISPECIES: hypothetical protein [unclassified Arthrobacter]|nr:MULTISPECIES: hypothetical protein [unclassified Arthrobacter]
MPDETKKRRFPTTERVAEELNVSVKQSKVLLERVICERPGPGP